MLSLRLLLLHLVHVVYALVAKCSALHRQYSRRRPLPPSRRGKLPLHLAVIFALDSLEGDDKGVEASVLESAYRCADWCREIGIERLSLYDSSGILFNSSALVRERVYSNVLVIESDSETEYPLTPPPSDYSDSRPISPELDVKMDLHAVTLCIPPQNASDDSKKLRLSFRRRGPLGTPLGGDAGPVKDSAPCDRPLNLHLLSIQSSKSAMAAAARSLARKHLKYLKLHGAPKGSTRRRFTLSVDELNTLLEGSSGFPSPDLLIIHRFNSPKTLVPPPQLCGFPPWQIRLTEVSYSQESLIQRPSLSSRQRTVPIDELAFRSALDEFSRAEMRLGK